MCKWGTDVVVRLAHALPVSGLTEVAVDACLAPLVQMLNDYGVHTTGCCCGHGREAGSVLYEQDDQQHELMVTAKPEKVSSPAPTGVSTGAPADLVALHTVCMQKYAKWQDAVERGDRKGVRGLEADFMFARNDLLAWHPAAPAGAPADLADLKARVAEAKRMTCLADFSDMATPLLDDLLAALAWHPAAPALPPGCPSCGHQAHAPGRCLNMASDAGCECVTGSTARAMMATLPPVEAPMDKHTIGLHHKFDVTRTDGTSAHGGKHHGCDYFVLDLTHDPHTQPALKAYADSCRADYPRLAADLDAKLPAALPPRDGLFDKFPDTVQGELAARPNVFIVSYSLKGYGFGSYTFLVQPDGSVLIDDECSSRDTIKRVLGMMVDKAVLYSERDDAEQPPVAALPPVEADTMPTIKVGDWVRHVYQEADRVVMVTVDVQEQYYGLVARHLVVEVRGERHGQLFIWRRPAPTGGQ